MTQPIVLIVDDEPDIISALTIRCEQLGLQVETATDGLQAAAIVGKTPPDLMLLDINMPAGDGLMLCEVFVSDEELKPIPKIILTGKSDEQTKQRCKELGAHYVLKSIDTWDELKKLIQQLIKLETVEENVPSSSNSIKQDSLESSGKLPRILVIDDDPEISKAMQIRLRSYGVEVIRAFAGKEGYWLAVSEKPDVIITDFQMPDGYGNYVLGRLKAHPITENIPVIIITGHDVSAGRNYALEREMISLGAESLLTKPIDFDKLLILLRKYIKIPKNPIETPVDLTQTHPVLPLEEEIKAQECR